MLRVIRLGHQNINRLADDLGGVAKQAFGRRIEGDDQPAIIHRVHGRVEKRLQFRRSHGAIETQIAAARP